MNSENINQSITIPTPFIKRLVYLSLSESRIREELKDFSIQHNLETKQTIYFFIKKLLKLDMFFEIKKEIIEPLLFEAVYWSSTVETKKKIRPKEICKVPTEKNNDFYTDLQKEMILAIHRKYNNSMALEIELKRFLILFYELSCIKRDRRKENDI